MTLVPEQTGEKNGVDLNSRIKEYKKVLARVVGRRTASEDSFRNNLVI